jgi:hypothetical protein
VWATINDKMYGTIKTHDNIKRGFPYMGVNMHQGGPVNAVLLNENEARIPKAI